MTEDRAELIEQQARDMIERPEDRVVEALEHAVEGLWVGANRAGNAQGMHVDGESPEAIDTYCGETRAKVRTYAYEVDTILPIARLQRDVVRATREWRRGITAAPFGSPAAQVIEALRLLDEGEQMSCECDKVFTGTGEDRHLSSCPVFKESIEGPTEGRKT